jgi:hypothetical protein
VLSGLAERSAVEGSRPYLSYFSTAWFRAFVPASFLNVSLDGSGPSVAPWILVAISQLTFWAIVVATITRTPLAIRGWALVVFIFVLNVAVVGGVRLAAFGVQIAYALRYYPEVVLFVPLALALGLRQGAERRPGLAWERTAAGRVAIGALTAVYVGGFLAWAPGMVSESPGVLARAWYENLRHDLDRLTAEAIEPRIIDSETPGYVMQDWMAPDNRVSTILQLLPIDVVFNDPHESAFFVGRDGHLEPVAFRPIDPIVSDATLAGDARILGGLASGSADACVGDGEMLVYRPATDIVGRRLALRVWYSETAGDGDQAALIVRAADPDRPRRYLALRPSPNGEELVELDATRLSGFSLEPAPGASICIDRMELGEIFEAGS